VLRREIGREFGLMSRVMSRVLGPVILWSARREARRLAAGQTYEPRTIVERRNWDWPRPLAAPGSLATAQCAKAVLGPFTMLK
jgi:hypothetical protein